MTINRYFCSVWIEAPSAECPNAMARKKRTFLEPCYSGPKHFKFILWRSGSLYEHMMRFGFSVIKFSVHIKHRAFRRIVSLLWRYVQMWKWYYWSTCSYQWARWARLCWNKRCWLYTDMTGNLVELFDRCWVANPQRRYLRVYSGWQSTYCRRQVPRCVRSTSWWSPGAR